jgi:hypothetical protein
VGGYHQARSSKVSVENDNIYIYAVTVVQSSAQMGRVYPAPYTFWSSLVFLTFPVCVSVLQDWGTHKQLTFLTYALILLLGTSLINHGRPYVCGQLGLINYVDRVAVILVSAGAAWRMHSQFGKTVFTILATIGLFIALVFVRIRFVVYRHTRAGELYVDQSTIWLHIFMHFLAAVFFTTVFYADTTTSM